MLRSGAGALPKISCRGTKGSQPGAAINHIFRDDMHDSFLMLQSSSDLQELCLKKRLPIFLRATACDR